MRGKKTVVSILTFVFLMTCGMVQAPVAQFDDDIPPPAPPVSDYDSSEPAASGYEDDSGFRLIRVNFLNEDGVENLADALEELFEDDDLMIKPVGKMLAIKADPDVSNRIVSIIEQQPQSEMELIPVHWFITEDQVEDLADTIMEIFGEQTVQALAFGSYLAIQADAETREMVKAFVREEGKSGFDLVPIKFLSEEEVENLVDAISEFLDDDAAMVQSFSNYIAIKADDTMALKIKELINGIDKMPRHIVFEASFVTVHPNEVKKIGHRLQHFDANREVSYDYDDGEYEIEEDLDDEDDPAVHFLDVNTDFGLAGAFTHSVVWTIKEGNRIFNLTTGYVLEEGIGKIISKPVIRVREGSSASFEDVINVPLQTWHDGTPDVEFEKAGIRLEVKKARIIDSPTPHLDDDDENYVPDLIWADISFADGSVSKEYGQGLVSTKDTSVNINGYYHNGETFIAGSLIEENDTYRIYAVPILHKIPLVGKLFRTKDTEHDKVETVVLIRPTIEEKYSQKFLASRYKDAQNLLSIKLGGRERDSIRIHPFSDAPWKGVPKIYKTCKGIDRTYWSLQRKYSDEQIEHLGELFKKVRNRVGLILGQNQGQLIKQIKYDEGLEAAANTVLDKFVADTGAPRPTIHEMLIAAAHIGNVNEWAFDVYMDAFGIKHTCK